MRCKCGALDVWIVGSIDIVHAADGRTAANGIFVNGSALLAAAVRVAHEVQMSRRGTRTKLRNSHILSATSAGDAMKRFAHSRVPPNPTFFETAEIVRARRGARCARVRGRRALDAGCVPARGGTSRTVRQRPQPVTLALDGRLAAFQGWVLEALRAPGA
jgi:hypothetical protein